MPIDNDTTVAALREELRRHAATRVKASAIGGGQEQPFEQAFSSLAHAYLKDKAPTLLDYEVGFQLLDRNQESTKAVGVFGFKVGTQWLYAPVFFLNGDLKGHELLYVKNQDLFVPLKENWLNYLLNRKPMVLGEEVGRNLRDIGVMPPHLYQLSRSPSKFAAALDAVAPWAREVLPALARAAHTNPATDKKYAGAVDLPTFLRKEGRAVIQSLVKGFIENPKLAACFAKFHDLSVIDEAVKAASVDSVLAESAAAAAGTATGSVLKSAKNQPAGDGVVYALERSLRVYTFDNVAQRGEDLDDSDREKLLRDRVLIKDDRKDDEVVEAYEVTSPVRLQNPDESGLYDVLVKPTKFEKCLVFMWPYDNCRRLDFATVVAVDGEGRKSWLNVHPGHVWVGKQYRREEFKEWFDKLSDADSLPAEGEGRYLLVGEDGQASAPFRVRRQVANGSRKSYDVYFSDYAHKSRPGNLPHMARRRDYDSEMCCGTSRVTLTGMLGGALRCVGEDLFVPGGFKLLRLEKPDDDECCNSCESDPPALEPGSQMDIDLLLGTKTASVKICDVGPEVEIEGRRMQKVAGLIHLVRDYRLREEAARELLKRAAKSGVVRFRVKKAYDLQRETSYSPGFPEPPSGYDPMTGNRTPTQNIGEWNLKVPELSAGLTDRMVYHPAGPEPSLGVGSGGPPAPDRQAQQAAMQAAQMGQKEVFDTSMIGSLLKAVKNDSMVDKYMGDLVKGLDRLGRILFLYYWHNDKFSDRYGKNEMTELEDGLRDAFEYLGDIVLFLKQRTVGDDPDVDNNINLSDVA